MIIALDLPMIPTPETPESAGALRNLLLHVIRGHYISAWNNPNVSTLVVKAVQSGNPGNVPSAVAAALLTIGAVHAPMAMARRVWEMTHDEFVAHMESGVIMAGWGNDFFKDRVDPAWEPVMEVLRQDFVPEWEKLQDRVGVMHRKSPTIWPNPGGLTAIACEIAKVPKGSEHLLFMLSRITAWTDILQQLEDDKDDEGGGM